MGKEIYHERVFASHPKQNVRHLLPDYPVLILSQRVPFSTEFYLF